MNGITARKLAKTWLRGGYFYENHSKSARCRLCRKWVSVKAYSLTENSNNLHDALVRHLHNECARSSVKAGA